MLDRLACALLAALVSLGPAVSARTRPANDGEPVLTVVSLNLAMREDVGAIVAELHARGLAPRAGLVLLQEVIQRDGAVDVGSGVAAELGLHSVFRPAYALDAHRVMGLAILSRAPLSDAHVVRLKRFDLSFRSRRRIALGAIAGTPAGPVKVYDVHLDTRINIDDRIAQLSAITDDLGGKGVLPTILGGDFNTNDNRWLFHTIPVPFAGHQRDGLLRFMSGIGFESAVTGRTPTHDALGMQLDWIFLRGLRASSTAIQPMDLSDHHALVASVTIDE